MAFLCEMTGLDQIVLEALPGCDFIGLRYALVNVIAEGLGADRNPSEA
jgi:hypothetical protein